MLSPSNPAGWEAPEPGKLGRELHRAGVVHHKGRMVLPVRNMQEITFSKICCLTGLEEPSTPVHQAPKSIWRHAASTATCRLSRQKISIEVFIVSMAAWRFWKAPQKASKGWGLGGPKSLGGFSRFWKCKYV